MPRRGTLWAIVGATGTGKSALSLDLAETLNASERHGSGSAEVVNADAMQLYRGMDIGTAKLAEDERRGIPHHLFDQLDVTEEASVAWYQSTARSLLSARLAEGVDMILVGGSGLYVSSVIYDFQFPPRDETVRRSLEETLERDGVDALLTEIRQIAPEVARTVDARNPRRVVRALEILRLGADAQVALPKAPSLWYENTRIVGVHAKRETLVPRIDDRVVQMWNEGLIDEVRELIPKGIERGVTAARAIGYAQAIAEIRGNMTRQEAIAETQMLTRRYARRQVSWFKRYRETLWIDAPDVRRIPRDIA